MGNRKYAVELYNSAVTAANDRSHPDKLERAYRLFCSSVVADPTYGQGWYQLGNNTADMKKNHAAIAMWRRALQCDNDKETTAKILTNLGWYLHEIGQTDEAVSCTRLSIEIAPTLAPAYTNLSQMLILLDDPQGAVDASAKGFELAPDNVQAEIALAFAQMFNRQFADGLQHFEQRFKWRLQGYLHSPYPQWKGEAGKTLYLMSDQGLGDTLSFARFVETAASRCKFIHASIHPELMRLFSHAFVHIKNINLIPQPNPFPEADYWTTFMSLPAAMRLTDDEIVNQKHIERPRFQITDNWKLPDCKLHIGVAWKGNVKSDIDKHRSFPVTQLMELYRVPGVQLYSLQVDDASSDLYDNLCLGVMPDLRTYIRDVADSLAITDHLDLVICLESALGHITGLAGKETWIPYSYAGRDYRAGARGENPIWYPKHRFFRQEKGETWRPVFERINAALKEKINGLGKQAGTPRENFGLQGPRFAVQSASG